MMTLKLDMKHFSKKGRRGLGLEQGRGWNITPRVCRGWRLHTQSFSEDGIQM